MERLIRVTATSGILPLSRRRTEPRLFRTIQRLNPNPHHLLASQMRQITRPRSQGLAAAFQTSGLVALCLLPLSLAVSLGGGAECVVPVLFAGAGLIFGSAIQKTRFAAGLGIAAIYFGAGLFLAAMAGMMKFAAILAVTLAPFGLWAMGQIAATGLSRRPRAENELIGYLNAVPPDRPTIILDKAGRCLWASGDPIPASGLGPPPIGADFLKSVALFDRPAMAFALDRTYSHAAPTTLTFRVADPESGRFGGYVAGELRTLGPDRIVLVMEAADQAAAPDLHSPMLDLAWRGSKFIEFETNSAENRDHSGGGVGVRSGENASARAAAAPGILFPEPPEFGRPTGEELESGPQSLRMRLGA